jgi:hypothetical protein
VTARPPRPEEAAAQSFGRGAVFENQAKAYLDEHYVRNSSSMKDSNFMSEFSIEDEGYKLDIHPH